MTEFSSPSPRLRVVLRETARSRGILSMAIAAIGLAVIAGAIMAGYLRDSELSLTATILVMAVVIAFGVSLLMSWRRSGHSEVLDISSGRLRLTDSSKKTPVLDARLSEVKMTRIKHSLLGTKIMLKHGTKMIDLASHMTPSQREDLADRMEQVLAAAPTFQSGKGFADSELYGLPAKNDEIQEDVTVASVNKKDDSL